jgi:hypothetical protein
VGKGPQDRCVRVGVYRDREIYSQSLFVSAAYAELHAVIRVWVRDVNITRVEKKNKKKKFRKYVREKVKKTRFFRTCRKKVEK